MQAPPHRGAPSARSRCRGALGVLALLGAVAAVATGCAVGRPFVALQSDHAAYRRFRTAETLDERIGWAWRYVEDYEGGRYDPLVRAWFERAEPIYWAVQSRSREGLERYLRALPDGPHAELAIDRLTEQRVLERRREARRSGAERALARLASEQSERERVARLPIDWLERLLDRPAWQGPLDDAPATLLVPWRLEPPRPVCFWDELSSLHRCTKSMAVGYPVVREGEVERRELAMSIELELDVDWRLQAARIFGPRLFVRSAEALARRPLEPADRAGPSARIDLLEQASIARATAGGLVCEEQARAGRWTLDCGSLRVVLELGADDEDDVIVVGRLH